VCVRSPCGRSLSRRCNPTPTQVEIPPETPLQQAVRLPWKHAFVGRTWPFMGTGVEKAGLWFGDAADLQQRSGMVQSRLTHGLIY